MGVVSGKPIKMVEQGKAQNEASFQRRLEEMGLTNTEYKKRQELPAWLKQEFEVNFDRGVQMVGAVMRDVKDGASRALRQTSSTEKRGANLRMIFPEILQGESSK